MSQKILIDGSESQAQFVLLSDSGLEDFEFESSSKKNLKGNIYLGKVSRIEASLQAAFVDIGSEKAACNEAAFVDIGSEKNGFLAFGEIHPNYFQIPVADREALIKAEAELEEEHNNIEEIKSNDMDEVPEDSSDIQEVPHEDALTGNNQNSSNKNGSKKSNSKNRLRLW